MARRRPRLLACPRRRADRIAPRGHVLGPHDRDITNRSPVGDQLHEIDHDKSVYNVCQMRCLFIAPHRRVMGRMNQPVGTGFTGRLS